MDELELINLSKQAHVAAAAGDREGAVRLFKQVLAQQPDNESALMNLANLVDDPAEKIGYLNQILELNPYSEDARTMLVQLEGHALIDQDTAASESVEVLYCYFHPERETTLRCNKCGKPICTQCAIRTPVGYRCPECIREQQDKFYTATTSDVIKGAFIAFVGGLFAGLVALLTIFFLGRFLFFGFLAAFFIGPTLGGAVAELVFRMMGKRRARNFPLVGAVLLFAGFLILLIPFGLLAWGLIPLGMALLLMTLALSTFYARLKF